MTLSEMLSRLQGVKRSGSQYTATCPAHNDRHASLFIGAGDDGRILMKCHAGDSLSVDRMTRNSNFRN